MSQQLPLEGIRVIDLSRFIAGPLCGQLLGDMGAEVIKLERPDGEDSRAHAPFVNGESMYMMMYNRNKLGATLNTRADQGVELLERLLVDADVLIENYRPGTLEKMGLGHERLQQLNPRLTVTSISGFGQSGPLAERALFDAIAQAMSGLMGITGRPSDPPMMVGTFIADYVAGFYGALGTMFSLFGRERTGRGQIVDVASLDAIFSCLGTKPSAYALLGEDSDRRGNRDQYTAPANLFEASDGFVYLHGGTQPLFRRLTELIGSPELAEDERFSTVAARMDHVSEVEGIVAKWVRVRSAKQCEAELGAAGIPVGLVATLADVVDSEQLAAREMIVEIDHPVAGQVPLLGQPIKMSGHRFTVRRTPPTVGQDNAYVYGELLGLSQQEITNLRSVGAI